MNHSQIRKKFLEFFKQRGHTIVPSSSLIPDDPSVLLTTAGMQQFKPYYTGKADAMKDFGSLNVASVQKSFRTSDIDEVGDESHLTFFEMLGNFSFGGYFSANGGSAYGGKKEAIRYGYDFFKEIGLPIEFVTVFGGDPSTSSGHVLPADEESEKIWRELGVSDIRRKGREDNFWGPTGSEGPCGPTTEIYVNGVEIWNIVFNQYYCKQDKTLIPFEKPGVDTGMGLERLAMVLQGKKNIFETDLFAPQLELLPKDMPEREKRILVDHARGAVFLLADGVRPSNKDREHILRHLMRRIFVYEKMYDIPLHIFDEIVHNIVRVYGEFYSELMRENENIRKEFAVEREKFSKTINGGLKILNREMQAQIMRPGGTYDVQDLSPVSNFPGFTPFIITGKWLFDFYQSFGFSPELTFEVLEKTLHRRFADFERKKMMIEFDNELKKHQEISRAGIEKKFGGHGLLLDTGELKAANEEELKKVTRLHTATHLLNAALRKVLRDSSIRQNGSDITAERTRFDFSFPRKLTQDEIKEVEDAVNEVVAKNMEVTREEMPYADAEQSGALHFFREKYPEVVSVYTVRDAKTGEVFSKELCGGPHVSYTAEIGHFKIAKEESSSAGVRRIRATVE